MPPIASSASSMPASGRSWASTARSIRTSAWRSRCSRSPRNRSGASSTGWRRTRRERDAAAVEAALAGLREAACRPGSSDTNLMPHFLRCAEAYATLGEQCGVLREVFGEYREPVAV